MAAMPGPWTAHIAPRIGNHAGGFSVETDDGIVICGRAGWPLKAADSEANAHLIASAPKLLAMLKTIAASDECCTFCGCHPHEYDCAVLAVIQEAEAR